MMKGKRKTIIEKPDKIKPVFLFCIYARQPAVIMVLEI